MIFKNPTPTRICSSHYTNHRANYATKQHLYEVLRDALPKQQAVFLCIGTDRATGDALGPLVGTKINRLNPDANVYGTLEHPAHALNLPEITDKIYQDYDHPLIIAVDACLGQIQRVGFLNFQAGGIHPGSALNKTLPCVGDYHLTGNVNVGGFCESMILQSTRLHLVFSMADTISYIISSALFALQRDTQALRKQKI